MSLGHEFSGTVSDVGEGVEGSRRGTTLPPTVFCPRRMRRMRRLLARQLPPVLQDWFYRALRRRGGKIVVDARWVPLGRMDRS
ncbi:hypothetical protein [Arthrobacter sp. 24S4-2]|uniref:hypothetical protein n=1 Tax=Arthrobacter sp. 24S4-2 TaxID=2575374 RepID=UPI0020C7EDB6|nr:hypothetical protein [Arthrobacter sp. 24S4-2]